MDGSCFFLYLVWFSPSTLKECQYKFCKLFGSLKTDIHLYYVQEFIFYLSQNKIPIRNKDKSVNVLGRRMRLL